MKYARSKGKIIQNPVDLVVLPSFSNAVYRKKKNEKVNSLEIFSDDEILRFVDATNATYSNDQRIYKNGSLFLLMLNTGLRIGEATGIKWTDYDDIDNTLRVSTCIVQTKDDNGKYVIIEQEGLKTEDSERVLKLNSNAIAALPKKKIGKYIFCTKDGKPLRPRSVQNMLDSILARAGIPHKSTHVFRHTFASKLFEKDMMLKLFLSY